MSLDRNKLNMTKGIAAPKIKRILVTGGAGFIGSALLPMLLEKQCEVRILDLLMYGPEPIKPWLDHPRLDVIQGDFRDMHVIQDAMQGVDAVVHLGAIVGDPACDLDPQVAIDVNLVATRLIADVAKASRVGHFIFASTCGVYGASDGTLDELSEMKPVTLYAQTKAAAEKSLLNKSDERFSPVILRFATIYGLSGRYRFDLVVNLLTAKALIDGVITIFGGNQWRAFVHVADAARVVMNILDSPTQAVRNEVFNVGSSQQNYTISQIGAMIQESIPEARIDHSVEEVDPQNYKVNCDKLQRALNYQAHWTVEQGIQQVIAAIQDGRVTDYRDARYSNLKFLSTYGMSAFENR